MIIIEESGRFAAFGAQMLRDHALCHAFVAVDDVEPGEYVAQCYLDHTDTPIRFKAIIEEYLEGDTVYDGTKVYMEDL